VLVWVYVSVRAHVCRCVGGWMRGWVGGCGGCLFVCVGGGGWGVGVGVGVGGGGGGGGGGVGGFFVLLGGGGGVMCVFVCVCVCVCVCVQQEERKPHHLGEILVGDRMMKTLYALPFHSAFICTYIFISICTYICIYNT